MAKCYGLLKKVSVEKPEEQRDVYLLNAFETFYEQLSRAVFSPDTQDVGKVLEKISKAFDGFGIEITHIERIYHKHDFPPHIEDGISDIRKKFVNVVGFLTKTSKGDYSLFTQMKKNIKTLKSELKIKKTTNYQGELYEILKVDAILKAFNKKDIKKATVNKTHLLTKMMKEKIPMKNEDLFTVLSTIPDTESYKLALLRVETPTLKAFKQFAEDNNINNAVQFYSYRKYKLKSGFGCKNLSILLEKTVNDRLEEPERYRLCAMLGWDLVEDTKKMLSDKGIDNGIDVFREYEEIPQSTINNIRRWHKGKNGEKGYFVEEGHFEVTSKVLIPFIQQLGFDIAEDATGIIQSQYPAKRLTDIFLEDLRFERVITRIIQKEYPKISELIGFDIKEKILQECREKLRKDKPHEYCAILICAIRRSNFPFGKKELSLILGKPINQMSITERKSLLIDALNVNLAKEISSLINEGQDSGKSIFKIIQDMGFAKKTLDIFSLNMEKISSHLEYDLIEALWKEFAKETQGKPNFFKGDSRKIGRKIGILRSKLLLGRNIRKFTITDKEDLMARLERHK